MLPLNLSKFQRRRLITLGHFAPSWPAWLTSLLVDTWGLCRYKVPVHRLDTHVYIVGKSGKGKSKFIEGFLWQLIVANQGCGLIDPHADLANNLLKILALHPVGKTKKAWLDDPDNAKKLIYCEPGRTDYFIPWNVLKSDDKPYTIASNVVEAFQRTWSATLSAAPQFKNITLHSLMLLIEHRQTLVQLPQLLLDDEFRRRLVATSRNQEVINFFNQRYEAWGKQQSSRTESLLNKVTALTLNDNLRNMLGAQDNQLDLRKIMDRGQILIVNLGTCDTETRSLIGSLLTVGLEHAAKSRIVLEEHQRRPWFCLIDEFQQFVANEGSAQVLAHILSEVRKMGLRLGLAHQGWHQITNSRLQGALDQAQVKVIFGSGTKTAKVVADEIFTPHPNESEFGTMAKQKEKFVEAIRNQHRREIFVTPPESTQVVALKTMSVPSPKVSLKQLDEVKILLMAKVGREVTVNRPKIKTQDESSAYITRQIQPQFIKPTKSFIG